MPEMKEVQERIAEAQALLLYVTTSDCSVCKVLRPKVQEMLTERYPKLEMVVVEMDREPEIGREYEVFSVPTVIAFFNGREFFRKVRVFGLEELAETLQRPYELLFS
jgi:thioredoxin-like negative regulator of GroEL